jgi:endogenous inhibitor of DNA gyrase (YacG/DUF329 family)
MAKDPVIPLPAGQRRCPICGKPATPRHQPFCSARCADIDLGRWLKGNYRIPTEEPPDEGSGEDEGETG